MPRGDGTGPMGTGQGAGRGGSFGMGAGGECVCPSCGRRVSHERGVPCSGKQCPQCGISMVRR